MKVQTITATLRYSKEEKGSWKSLELGLEASIDERENWQAAQATLYADLARQFKVLWSANGATPPETHQESHFDRLRTSHRIDVQPSSAQSSPENQRPKEHWCAEHSQEFKARNGPYGEFYSHQIKGTREFCNEKKGVV